MADTGSPELKVLQEWARVGLCLYIAANATISLRYPNQGAEVVAERAESARGDTTQAEERS